MKREIKQELKRIHVCGFRWNERLKPKTERSTHLKYTRLCGGLGHLKIETRLRGEMFETWMWWVSVWSRSCLGKNKSHSLTGLDFIMNRSNESYENLYMSVGVMKDYKLRNLCASHTLGWSWNDCCLFLINRESESWLSVRWKTKN